MTSLTLSHSNQRIQFFITYLHLRADENIAYGSLTVCLVFIAPNFNIHDHTKILATKQLKKKTVWRAFHVIRP